MRLDKLEIRWLKLFCKIVEKEGITNAQIATGLSQPVLSHYLRQLEEILGVVLCERGRGGFSLTGEGEVVYREALSLIRTLDDFGARLASIQHQLVGQVRLGCLDNTVTHPGEVLSKAIAKVYQKSIDAEVELHVGDYSLLMERLKSGQLDMLLTVLPDDLPQHIYLEPVFTEHSLFYGPADIAERVEEEWRNGKLDPSRLMVGGYATREICRQLGLPISKASSYGLWPLHVEGGLIMMLAGTHVSFMPEHYMQPWVEKGKIKPIAPDELSLYSTFYLVRHQKRRLSPVAEVLWGYLLEAGKPYLK